MDGLGAVEITFREIAAHKQVRLDSEYAAHSETKWLERLVAQKEFVPLNEVLDGIGSGHTPYKHDVSTGNVSFMTVECINDLSLDEEKLKHITTDQFIDEFQQKQVVKNSLVCTIKRRICKAYPFINAPKEPIVINQDVALLIPKTGVLAAYLATYLNSKIGQTFADKQKTGQMNPYISVDNLSALPVHLATVNFQNSISQLLSFAYSIKEQSVSHYQQAEKLLLSELGLTDWQPTTKNVEFKSFRNSFLDSGRLDAEYYQPKYDELEIILQATGDAVELGSLLTFNQRGSQPQYVEEGGIVVLNSKHIRENKIDFSDNRQADSGVARTNTIICKGDVLINGTGVGTIGRAAAYVRNENALPDNHVTILRSKVIEPLFLALQLNSLIGRLQVEKHQKGSSGQIELYPTDINQFTIWLAPTDIQTKIKDQIERAYSLETQSKQLLEIAKSGVERAIEENEETALVWMKKQMNPVK